MVDRHARLLRGRAYQRKFTARRPEGRRTRRVEGSTPGQGMEIFRLCAPEVCEFELSTNEMDVSAVFFYAVGDDDVDHRATSARTFVVTDTHSLCSWALRVAACLAPGDLQS